MCKRFNIPNGGLYPIKAYDGDAGYDLFLPEHVTIGAHQTLRLDLKVSVNLKKGECGIICMRSSMAIKGLIANTAPIDYTYKGNIHLILHNVENYNVFIPANKAICQLVILKIPYSKGVFGKRGLDNKGFGTTERRLRNAKK